MTIQELSLPLFQGQKVAGYTQLDVSQWIAQVSKNGTPIMIKTVKQGKWHFSVGTGEVIVDTE